MQKPFGCQRHAILSDPKDTKTFLLDPFHTKIFWIPKDTETFFVLKDTKTFSDENPKDTKTFWIQDHGQRYENLDKPCVLCAACGIIIDVDDTNTNSIIIRLYHGAQMIMTEETDVKKMKGKGEMLLSWGGVLFFWRG